jgi:hypothetical protein
MDADADADLVLVCVECKRRSERDARGSRALPHRRRRNGGLVPECARDRFSDA